MTTDTTDQPRIDFQTLRLDGVYRMNDCDELMLRIKVPAGVLSAIQADKVADLADVYAGGRLHLTTRGSVELHRVRFVDLPAIGRGLAAVGLTSRGACGGAVRGIACSTSFSPNFATTQAFARRLHRHFTGNPHFEGLPKKFKIAVEDGYAGARHLIQDAGLVLTGREGEEPLYDLWVGGGLGREPQAALLLEENLPESRVIHLVEAIIRTYRKHTPPPRRLKYLVRTLGEASFRRLLQQEISAGSAQLMAGGLDASPAPGTGRQPVTARIFAGDLDSATFRYLAGLASSYGNDFLAVTADQDIAFAPAGEEEEAQLQGKLASIGFSNATPDEQTSFRVCVGSHACRMGLSPTRDVARQVLASLHANLRHRRWAISGCPNSCSQPQLADFGIITRRLIMEDDGERSPRFDLYRRSGEGLGEKIVSDLPLQKLLQVVKMEELMAQSG